VSKYFPCPCGSKALYHKCCKRFHDGELPTNAQLLMKSRYCAYALDKPDYIIETTHAENPRRQDNLEEWRNDLHSFSQNTQFHSLEVIEFVDGEREAFVTFTANLHQGDRDVSFTERSAFEKVDGRWLYKSGEIDGDR